MDVNHFWQNPYYFVQTAYCIAELLMNTICATSYAVLMPRSVKIDLDLYGVDIF